MLHLAGTVAVDGSVRRGRAVLSASASGVFAFLFVVFLASRVSIEASDATDSNLSWFFQPTFYGWCGTSFTEHGQSERLEQRLEIDPDEMYERIEVPKFGANRPAVFVHDFRQVGPVVECYLRNANRLLPLSGPFFPRNGICGRAR